MTISIVATVRNERETIGEFVASLLSQDLRADEIIIVDGNSTDGTKEILEGFVRDGHIRLISRDCNIAQGRNIGIAAATHERIAITDAGCVVDRLWLRRLQECFDSAQQPDVVAGNFRFDARSDFERAVVLATFPPNRDDTEAARYYPSSRSLAVTKSAWKAAGGYPEWLYAAEDTLFNIRLRQLGFKFSFCRDAIVVWRPRDSLRALGRQRINFARGNARVGIASSGYLVNLRNHGAALLCAALAPVWPAFTLLFVAIAYLHVARNLWPQASVATASAGAPGLRPKVVLLMEFVRICGMWGFVRGRLDRILDGSFVARQREWMGTDDADRVLARIR